MSPNSGTVQRRARATPGERGAGGPGSSLGTAETHERRRFFAASLALGLLVLLVFGRAVSSEFVVIDDPTYVTNNEWVSQGLTVESMGRAFGEVRASNWHPLTWISHMLDVELYGMQPWGHHLTNVLLHALGTVLLGFALRRMTGAPWASLLAAALYGLHPLRVESVLWIAERKDLLAAAFGMLALVSYAAYARRGGPGRYLATALCLGLGLLSKPTLVTLPLLLLLLDAWPLNRWRPDAAGRGSGRAMFEKIPLLALAAASSLVTLWSQGSGGALVDVERLPLLARVPNAAFSYGAYLLDFVWPSGLAVHYPHPWATAPDRWTGLYLPALVAGVLLFALSAVAWHFRRSRPWLPVGWLWYLVALTPMIGIVQVGTQARADRYTLLPSIGLAILVAWSLRELHRARGFGRAIATGTAATILVVLAALTWHQTGYWKDSLTLFAHAVEVEPNSALARLNHGVALADAGRRDEAAREYEAARTLNPAEPRVHFNLGNLERALGNGPRAEAHYREAIERAGAYPEAWLNLGLVLLDAGRTAAALEAFERAEEQRPGWHDARLNRANVLQLLDRPAESIVLYRALLEQVPDHVEARLGLAGALVGAGDPKGGLDLLRDLLDEYPDLLPARVLEAHALDRDGRPRDAGQAWREVLRLDPGNVAARRRLGLEDSY